MDLDDSSAASGQADQSAEMTACSVNLSRVMHQEKAKSPEPPAELGRAREARETACIATETSLALARHVVRIRGPIAVVRRVSVPSEVA